MQGEGQEFESPRLHHLLAAATPDLGHRSTAPCPRASRPPTSGPLEGPGRTPDLGGPYGPHLTNWICEIGRKRSRRSSISPCCRMNYPDSPTSMTTGSAAGGGQATQGTRWMPWRQEPMKDAAGCEKLRGVASRRYIRRYPNGETRLEKSSHSWLNQIGQVEVSQRTETSQ